VIQEFRYGKLTGRTFSTGTEFMSYLKQLAQEREDRKQPKQTTPREVPM